METAKHILSTLLIAKAQLTAHANHVFATGTRVIGRIHTVSVWVLLNVALDAPCSCFESFLLLGKCLVERDAQVSPMDWREAS